MTDSDLKYTQQLFDPGRLVILFTLDATALGGPILRFTSSAFETAAIVFDGQTYTPINVEAEGFESDSDGALPVPVLRVSNVEFTFQALLYNFTDLVGATLTRLRTFRQFLDGGVDPDPNAHFPLDVYIINRKTRQNKIFVEWELKSPLDQEDQYLPGRQVLKNSCSHVYRVWTGSVFDYSKATCPYIGTSYFSVGNAPESLPENDQCGKRLSSCKLRFGENATLPFSGFPGVMKRSA